jgi:hypothetical protein
MPQIVFCNAYIIRQGQLIDQKGNTTVQTISHRRVHYQYIIGLYY